MTFLALTTMKYQVVMCTLTPTIHEDRVMWLSCLAHHWIRPVRNMTLRITLVINNFVGDNLPLCLKFAIHMFGNGVGSLRVKIRYAGSEEQIPDQVKQWLLQKTFLNIFNIFFFIPSFSGKWVVNRATIGMLHKFPFHRRSFLIKLFLRAKLD